MNSDSDDEISNLRAAALSSRPSNVRLLCLKINLFYSLQ
jgi:hypothetical protein